MTLHVDSITEIDGGPPIVRYGKMLFVDLAGSERLKKSRSSGDMLKETGNINRSLFTLGKVINIIYEMLLLCWSSVFLNKEKCTNEQRETQSEISLVHSSKTPYLNNSLRITYLPKGRMLCSDHSREELCLVSNKLFSKAWDIPTLDLE
jgi:hypothetical protein